MDGRDGAGYPQAGAGAAGQPPQPAAAVAGQPAQPAAGVAGQPAQPAAGAAGQPAQPAAGAAGQPAQPAAGAAGQPAQPAAGAAGQPAQPAAGAAGQPAQPAAGAAGQPPQPAAGAAGQPAQPAAGAAGQPPQPAAGAAGQPAQPAAGAAGQPPQPAAGAAGQPPQPAAGAAGQPAQPAAGAAGQPPQPAAGAAGQPPQPAAGAAGQPPQPAAGGGAPVLPFAAVRQPRGDGFASVFTAAKDDILKAMSAYGELLKAHCEDETDLTVPDYFKAGIAVKNLQNFKPERLITSVVTELDKRLQHWEKRAVQFKVANLAVTLFVIVMQIIQVIIFQTVADGPARDAVSSIFPAITGAIIAIQLKLNWVSKGHKAKKYANLYKTILRQLEYRKYVMDAEGEIDKEAFVKVWNAVLQAEQQDVPAFLYCC